MRLSLFIIFIFTICAFCKAQEFEVFERNGRYGIMEPEGKVVIPAVYEKLGWSDGSEEIFEETIGYREGKQWGLLSIRNKKILANSYYTLIPFKEGYLKASIRGKFSNQLFFGLLDTAGEIQISFSYFGLQLLDEYIVASAFDPYGIKEGVLSFANQILIPIEYKSIAMLEHWFVAQNHDLSNDVYTRLGRPILQGVDSTSRINGLVCYQNGKAGYINENGQIIHEMTNKAVDIKDGSLTVEEFPTWEVYEADVKVFEWKCDSIELKNDVWITYLNGAQHLILPFESTVDWKEYELKKIVEDKWVVQHTKSKSWAVLKDNGEEVVPNHDHIEVIGSSFLAEKKGGWVVYNKFGSKVSKFPFQAIAPGVDQQFTAKRNDYWGIVDQYDARVTTFKYDSIKRGSAGLYAVKFLSKWGIMDKHGNWRIYPRFDEITNHGPLMVGRKGKGFSYFRDGQFLFITTFVITRTVDNYMVIEDEFDQQGLMNPAGNLLVSPAFETIRRTGDLFILQVQDSVEIVDVDGRKIVELQRGFQDAGEVSEDYLPVKKSGRWGFMDYRARLRISNRYEEVQPFSDGLAAIKLRGRWGFIDLDEKLRIQPFYDFVSPFKNGLAIVMSDGRYGLINRDGQEVVSIDYSVIKRLSTGNYLVRGERSRAGLVDAQGKFILRPSFDSLLDLGNQVIIEENGQMGVLDYGGRPRFRTSYRDIRKIGDYIVLKK